MSASTAKTMDSSSHSQANNSIPPNSTTGQSVHQIKAARATPNFGFKFYRNLSKVYQESTPEKEEDLLRSKKLEPLSPFLKIPLEIRLHIYSYVLASHPVFHAHLAPPTTIVPSSSLSEGNRTEVLYTTIPRPIGSSNPSKVTCTTTTCPSQQHTISAVYPFPLPTLASPRGEIHPRGKIPTGLLCTSKQIYSESHLLPWQNNTFSFINWFWSGAYASRQFTRSLRPWQSDAMRWVGVEVLGRDLEVGAGSSSKMVSKWGLVAEDETVKTVSEWVDLCSLWKGVWGLSLCIKGSVRVKRSTPYVEEGGVWVRPEEIAMVEGFLSETDERRKRMGILDSEQDWIRDGLSQLKCLRWIELEIEDEDLERDDKMLFCVELGKALNKGERVWGGETRVVLVERRKHEDVPNRDFELLGGEQGNE